ncbi:T9SS type A sorting domain-containing protein [Hymenobacter crusticola]|uniref:T9SS type A sorting domain-containing protein n=1 Tax=Hymenobacter crusticola TaxID=1770526 RepID=UPI00117B9915|nr:T9SS type A sorting domain-containing protein [Hymenobacter crusticola]
MLFLVTPKGRLTSAGLYVFLSRWSNVLLLATVVGQSTPAIAQQLPLTRLWDHTYGGSGNSQDEPASLVPTADGGCLVGGSSVSGISGTHSQTAEGARDYWLIKLSAQGVQQWDQRFGGSGEDRLAVVRPTTDGGYLLGGTSYSQYSSGDKSENNWGTDDFWVVKTTSTGIKVWDKTLGTFSSDQLHDLVETDDGGYLLAGETNDNGTGNYDFYLVKITAEGKRQWDVHYGGAQHDELRVIRRTADHGFLLAGTSASTTGMDKTQPSRGGQDYWVVKVNQFGIKEWDRTYGGPGNDVLSSMQLTPDGGFILGGTSTSEAGGEKSQASRGGKDMWVVKVNVAGTVDWDRRFGGDLEENLAAIQPVAGGFLLGGSSWSGSGGDKAQPNWGYCDYWLLRVDEQGSLEWERRYGGESIDMLNAVTLLADGSCLVAGSSTSSGLPALGDKTQYNYGFVNFWVLKMAAVLPLKSTEPRWARLVSVFPVPASSSLHVVLPPLPNASSATLSLIDALGRVVLVHPVSVPMTPSAEVTLPVAQLPAGSYLLRMEVTGQTPLLRRIWVQ